MLCCSYLFSWGIILPNGVLREYRDILARLLNLGLGIPEGQLSDPYGNVLVEHTFEGIEISAKIHFQEGDGHQPGPNEIIILNFLVQPVLGKLRLIGHVFFPLPSAQKNN